MDRDALQFFLLNIVRQIGIIPHDDLEAHVEYAREQISFADGIGPLLDPTGWIRAQSTGEFDMARAHLEMCEHILSIRKLMNQHEALRQEYLKKTGEQP